MEDQPNASHEMLAFASDIVAAYAGRNQMASSELPGLIHEVHSTLAGLSDSGSEMIEPEAKQTTAAPSVPIDASVGKDAIICLDCGKSFKTLKRHISTEHDMSPAEYRERWQLSKDYPLVAPAYSKRRSATAKKIGLGRKPKAK